MKDGIATVYISWDDFFDFVREKGGFDGSTILIIGRPRKDDPDEIMVDVVFSETDVHPDDWGGDSAFEVDRIRESWK